MKGKMLFKGVAGSPGIAVAKVRVVNGDDAKLAKVEEGEVLVGDKFVPKHDAYLKKAGALVQNTGGKTSHGNVYAKGRGIPAVSGTLGYGNVATDILVDGQKVVIDGLAGYEDVTDKKTGEVRKKPYGAVYEYIEEPPKDKAPSKVDLSELAKKYNIKLKGE